MAVSGQDIGLLFGVLGGGRINGESGTLIKTQLDSIVASLNNATNSKQRRIKLNLDIAGTKSSFREGLRRITGDLSGQKQFKIKVSEIDATSAINKLRTELDAMLRTIKVDTGFTVTLGKNGASSAMKEIANDAKGAVLSIAEAEAALKEISVTNQSITAGYKKAKNALGGEAATEGNLIAVEQLKEKYLQLQAATNSLGASKTQLHQNEVNQIYVLQSALQQLIAQTMERVAAENAVADAAKKRADAETAATEKEKAAATDVITMRKDAIALQKRMTSALSNFSKASGTPWYQTISAGKAELDAMLSGATELNRVRLNNLIDSFNASEGAIRGAGLAAKNFGDTIVANTKKFTRWFGISQVIMRIVRLMRDMVTAVKDIDSAMTELRKVTNETEITYTRFLENSAVRAKELGATISDTVNASADFARLGYSLNEAAELADAALVYKNVGDGIEEIGDASESVISTMRAFNIEAENSMFIVDKFNEVGNNFPISSKGVGDALLRSASALAAGNNSLDESIGLITAANSVVQDADKVGTALKTVSMFLRAAKTEAEEAGESTEGMAESVSELRGEILALTGGKVDIQLNDDTFKGTFQIIKELSEVWGELTDISQANILEMIGGKRNSNVVAALLNNFQIAEDVVKASADAAGSALAENEKYLDSIAGKVSVLRGAFEGMSWSVLDSDLVKSVVDFGTALLSVAGGLAKIDMLLPSILAAAVTYKSLKMAQSVAQLAVQEEAAVASLVQRLVAEKSTNDNLIVSYQTLNAVQQQNVLTKLQEATVTGRLTQEAYKQIVATLSYTAATTGASAATDKLNISIKALLASNPIGWIMMAISLIPVAINLLGKLHKSNEELIQDAEDLKASFEDSFGGTANDLATLRGLEEEFYKLSDGVDDYGNNVSLAADDYERYREIVSTILGISPSLISGYNSEGEAIANKNSLLEKSIQLMEEEQRLKMMEFTSDENIVSIGIGAAASLKEYQASNPLPFGDARKDFAKAFSDAAARYASEAQSYEGEIYDALNPDNIDLDNFWELDDYWNEYGDDADRFALDYYETIIEAFRNNRSVLEDYFTQSEIDNLLDIISEHDSNMAVYNSKVEEYSKALNPSLQYVPQALAAYGELTDGQKEFLTQYVNSFRITTNTTEEGFLQMKQDILDFTSFLANDEALKQSINLGMSIKTGIDESGDELSVSEYRRRIDELTEQINSYGAEKQVEIKAAFGIETDASELNPEVEEAVAHAKNLLKDEFDEKVDDLSINDILLYYKVAADPNSLTLEELEKKAAMLSVDWGEMTNVRDFSALSDEIGEIEGKFQSLITAMDSLRNGTKLTAGELGKLALEYPELLKVSNLFADTSIENQQAMLDATLGTYESEYDALIDTKIAELTATNQLIQDQIALENTKKDKVIEITDMQSNGKLDSQRDYQKLLDELHDLEGKNFVKHSDGILDVNQDMLEQELKQIGEKVEATRPLFGAQGDMIVEANFKGVDRALKAFPRYASKLATWANTSFKSLMGNIGTNISKLLSGEGEWKGLFEGISSIGSVFDDAPITLETVVEGDYTIDDKSVSEWTTEYKEVIDDRVKTLKEQAEINDTMIDNLTKLKGLSLESIYGSSNGETNRGDSASEKLEEYTADIGRYREALERLARLRIDKEDLEAQLSNSDDLNEQIALQKRLLGVYQDEREMLEEINGLRDDTISNGVKTLEQLGFKVDYDPGSNKLFVENLEHLNKLVADSPGSYESLQEATNALRQDTEDLINTMEELNAENQEDTDTWQELYRAIREAKINIVSDLKEIVNQASEAVDQIQNVYDILKSAAEEYAANDGFISVDAFQKIVELGPEYMQYLRDENELLVINKEAVNRVIAAKTEQLALESAMSYIERMRLALQDDSIEDLDSLLYATTESTNATWGLVYANLALLDLGGDQYQAALYNINAIRALANSAITGIGQVAGTVEEDLNDMKGGLDDILGYVMDMLRHRTEQQAEAIEEMKESYRELIELKKESMQATRDETDYQDEVADKIKEIAKIQERINALSLDDSRDARAQKAQLQEEMAELQEELADFQMEHAMDAQIESLDKMQEAYEKEKDEEIAILEEAINSEQKLYEMAISYIENNWDTLYKELIGWNTEYGDELNSEIASAWDSCLAAAQRYGNYVNALNNIDTDIENVGSGSATVVGNTSYDAASSAEENIRAIIKEMSDNGKAWGNASKTKQDELSKRNLYLGEQLLPQYGINAHRGDDGVWYLDNGELLFEKYKRYCYHTGGIAGDQGTLKENELLAKLERGEPVISNQSKGTLFSLIEFVDMLSKKLDTASVGSELRQTVKDIVPSLSNITNNQNESIHFGDVYIYGANDQTVEKHREVTREFANEVLKQLNIKR